MKEFEDGIAVEEMDAFYGVFGMKLVDYPQHPKGHLVALFLEDDGWCTYLTKFDEAWLPSLSRLANEMRLLVERKGHTRWACKGGTKMGCHVYCVCDGTDPATIDPRL